MIVCLTLELAFAHALDHVLNAPFRNPAQARVHTERLTSGHLVCG
jgi:hypothetical protein